MLELYLPFALHLIQGSECGMRICNCLGSYREGLENKKILTLGCRLSCNQLDKPPVSYLIKNQGEFIMKTMEKEFFDQLNVF